MSLKQEPELGKNFWLAMLLSMLVLIGYPYLMAKFTPQTQPVETTAIENTAAPEPVVAQTPAVPAVEAAGQLLAGKEPEFFDYQNAQYKIRFSSLGATIVFLEQTGKIGPEAHGTVFYSRPETPLRAGSFGLRFAHEPADLTYTLFTRAPAVPGSNRVEYVYEKPGEYRVTKAFVMSAAQATIALEVQVENLSSYEKHYPIELTYGMDFDPLAKTDLHFTEAVFFSEKTETAKTDKVQKKGFFSTKTVVWSALVKKYYMLAVKPEWKTVAAETRAAPGEATMNTLLRMEPVTLTAGEKQTRKFVIYAGPQHYDSLKKTGTGFEQYFSRGMLGVFKVWLLLGLNFFYGYLHNYGWAIIALTVLIKILFTPITHISFKSQRKMQAIQPKMKALQERYKGNTEKLHKETMELFKRNRVNPMAGCLPMLAQMPVLIAMYHLLSEAVELQGAPFVGWIADLSQPDRLFMLPFTVPFLGWDALNVLPVLMIASQYGFQKIMPQPSTSPDQAFMFKLMPVMFGFICYNMPSGLVLYWSLQNVLSIAHHVVVSRKPVDLHHEDR